MQWREGKRFTVVFCHENGIMKTLETFVHTKPTQLTNEVLLIVSWNCAFLSLLSLKASHNWIWLSSSLITVSKFNATSILALHFACFSANETKMHTNVLGETTTQKPTIKMLLSFEDRTKACMCARVCKENKWHKSRHRQFTSPKCRWKKTSERDKRRWKFIIIVLCSSKAEHELFSFFSFFTLLCLIEGKFLIATMQKKSDLVVGDEIEIEREGGKFVLVGADRKGFNCMEKLEEDWWKDGAGQKISYLKLWRRKSFLDVFQFFCLEILRYF